MGMAATSWGWQRHRSDQMLAAETHGEPRASETSGRVRSGPADPIMRGIATTSDTMAGPARPNSTPRRIRHPPYGAPRRQLIESGSDSCLPVESVPAAGPELAVAGVAEPWQDVALLVQAAVERRAMDRHVRMGRADGRDALRRGDQVDQLD